MGKRPKVRQHRKRRRQACRSRIVNIVITLKYLGAPCMFVELVLACLFHKSFKFFKTVDWIEYFAGDREVTEAQLRDGRLAVPYDIKMSPDHMNMLTDKGFLYALFLALNGDDGKGSLAAIVCSTWVYMNSGTSRRCRGRPLGAQSVRSVHAANVMVARMVLLLLLLHAVGMFFLVEQPRGSLMEKHPSFQWLLGVVKIWKKSFLMKNFGARTEKGTWLYSNHPEVNDIDQYYIPWHERCCASNVEMVRKTVNAAGKLCINGGRDLKGSQSYPRAFGCAVAKLFTRHQEEFTKRAVELHRAAWLGTWSPRSGSEDVWCKAELWSVFQLLLN